MIVSLKNRWLLSVALSVIISLLVSGVISYRLISQEVQASLIEANKYELMAKKQMAKAAIEQYFSTINKQLLDKSLNPNVIEATIQFKQAFKDYSFQNIADIDTAKDAVHRFYKSVFGQKFKQTTFDNIDNNTLTNGLTDTSYLLQSDFIANNPNPLGSKDNLFTLANNTDYASVHNQYHLGFKNFIQFFNFYDAFIVDADSGDIIYSVYKEIDFATNLKSGPHKNSGIAKAFNEALNLSSGEVYLTDFSPYIPSYNAQASFIAAPIFKDNKKIGVLIFQMPIEDISHLINQNERWSEHGFGKTGEIAIIGENQTLRNESRAFIENKQDYIAKLQSTNPSLSDIIQKMNTTIGVQPVALEHVHLALQGESGFMTTKNYLGVETLSSYAPIKVDNLNWAIIANVALEEALEPSFFILKKLRTTIIICSLILSAFFIGISFWLVNKLVKPINNIGKQFKNLNEGNASVDTRINISKVPEIGIIAEQFNLFVSKIQNLINDVSTSSDAIASASEQLSCTTLQSKASLQTQGKRTNEVTQSVKEFNHTLTTINADAKSAMMSMVETQKKITQNTLQSKQAVNNITQLVEQTATSANTILDLKDKVVGINEVLVVIDSIASQTNLLALNAAIEAARAGEFGRGFAVVADEVRSLASRTQQSTIEIQEKIDALTDVAQQAANVMSMASNSANSGIELVNQVSSNLMEVDNEIQAFTELSEQATAINEAQQEKCEDIGKKLVSIQQVANEQSQSSVEIEQASQSLASVASTLQNIVSQFK